MFKVIEGAAYTLALQPDPKLDTYLDDLIAKIAAAQEPDGYLYTARTHSPREDAAWISSGQTRWSNLGGSHELYNVGHLYEAAVAHFQATGKRSLLDVALKNADLLCETFGPGKACRNRPATRRSRSAWSSSTAPPATGSIWSRPSSSATSAAAPKRTSCAALTSRTTSRSSSRTKPSATPCAPAISTPAWPTWRRSPATTAYVQAIDRLWENVVGKKMHLTGGIGASRGGEAFGANYDLPNASAYLETCAAIANALWNHRMFLLHGDAKYIDVLERVIYNGFLSGVSMTGDRFFYPNPLETDGKSKFNHGSNERAPWFGCSCCPVNDVRFIPEIASFIYATRGSDLFVNLFIGGSAKVRSGRHAGRSEASDALSLGRPGHAHAHAGQSRGVYPEPPHPRLGAQSACARATSIAMTTGSARR